MGLEGPAHCVVYILPPTPSLSTLFLFPDSLSGDIACHDGSPHVLCGSPEILYNDFELTP